MDANFTLICKEVFVLVGGEGNKGKTGYIWEIYLDYTQRSRTVQAGRGIKVWVAGGGSLQEDIKVW